MTAEPPSMPERLPRGKPVLSIDQIEQIAKLSEKYLQCEAAEFSENELLSNLRALYEISLQKENKISRRHTKQISELAIAAASIFGSHNILATNNITKESHKAEPKNRISRFMQGMKEGIMATREKTSKKKQEKPAADESKAAFYRQRADSYREKGKFGKAGKSYEFAAGYASGYEKVRLYSEAEGAYKKAGKAEKAAKAHKSFFEAALEAEQSNASSIRALRKLEQLSRLNIDWPMRIENRMQDTGAFFEGAIRFSRSLAENQQKVDGYIAFRSLLDQALLPGELSEFEKGKKSISRKDLQILHDDIGEIKGWKLSALEKLHNAYTSDDQKRIGEIINEINARDKTGWKPIYTTIGTDYDGYLYTNIATSKIAAGGIRADRNFDTSSVSGTDGNLSVAQYASRLEKILKEGFKTSGRVLRHPILGVSHIHNLFGYFEPLGYTDDIGAIVKWKPSGYCLLEYRGGIRERKEAAVLSPYGIKPKEITILLKQPQNATLFGEKEWIYGLSEELAKRGIPFEYIQQ